MTNLNVFFPYFFPYSKNIATMYIPADGINLHIWFKCTVNFYACFNFFSTNTEENAKYESQYSSQVQMKFLLIKMINVHEMRCQASLLKTFISLKTRTLTLLTKIQLCLNLLNYLTLRPWQVIYWYIELLPFYIHGSLLIFIKFPKCSYTGK